VAYLLTRIYRRIIILTKFSLGASIPTNSIDSAILSTSKSRLIGAHRLTDDLDTLLFTDGYPPIYNRPVETSQWQAAYISTYLERDVRQLINVKDIALFQRFLRICAHHVGQLVNLTQIANDCGITHKTAESWLSVLESSYLIRRLQPWYRNFNKRLVKTPKLYFYDTGLACWLLGIRSAEQVSHHAMRGALFENLVVSEAYKALFNQGEVPEIWFWRDRSGHEISVVPWQQMDGLWVGDELWLHEYRVSVNLD